MTLVGWSRTDGYAALAPSKLLNYFQLPALRVASTRWVHRGPSTAAIAGLTPYDENWMQVPDPLPLVRLVTHVVQSQDPAQDLAKIDIRREALCEYALALPPGKAGTAALTQHRGGQMAVKVCCSSPQLLVIAESYHPGWRCTIDGSPAPVYRVNGDFLGCVVEPGNAEVRLEFHPDSLWRRPAGHLGRPRADRPLSLGRQCPARTDAGREGWLEPRRGRRRSRGCAVEFGPIQLP